MKKFTPCYLHDANSSVTVESKIYNKGFFNLILWL